MGNGISKEEIAELKCCTTLNARQLWTFHKDFKELDQDDSDMIDRKEFEEFGRVYLKAANIPRHRLDAYFDAFDRDKNGTISFKEFAMAMAILNSGSKEEKLAFMFDMFDKDQNGSLSKAELSDLILLLSDTVNKIGMYAMCSPETIANLVRELDLNNDGVMSREEWITAAGQKRMLIALLQI